MDIASATTVKTRRVLKVPAELGDNPEVQLCLMYEVVPLANLFLPTCATISHPGLPCVPPYLTSVTHTADLNLHRTPTVWWKALSFAKVPHRPGDTILFSGFPTTSILSRWCAWTATFSCADCYRGERRGSSQWRTCPLEPSLMAFRIQFIWQVSLLNHIFPRSGQGDWSVLHSSFSDVHMLFVPNTL